MFCKHATIEFNVISNLTMVFFPDMSVKYDYFYTVNIKMCYKYISSAINRYSAFLGDFESFSNFLKLNHMCKFIFRTTCITYFFKIFLARRFYLPIYAMTCASYIKYKCTVRILWLNMLLRIFKSQRTTSTNDVQKPRHFKYLSSQLYNKQVYLLVGSVINLLPL